MAIKAGPKPDLYGKLPTDLSGSEFAAATHGALYSWQAPLVDELTAPTRPRVAYVQVPRKNGKSRLGASVALYELARGGQVFLISDSERNLKSALYHEICTLIRKSRVLSNAIHIYKDHLECPSSGGLLNLRANNISASQSINPTLVVFDEVHMQKTDAVWNGMVLATAADLNACVLGITTPGYDTASMAHDLYDQVQAGDLWGKVFEPERSDCPHDDLTALWESNPVLLDRPELESVFLAELKRVPPHEYRRFRLGQWTETATAWLPYGAWEARTGHEAFDWTVPVRLGFDGSYSGDSTALVAANRLGQLMALGVWERPDGTLGEGWRVPREKVHEAVADAMGRGPNVTLLADPPYWQAEIQTWTDRWPGRVLEFPTGTPGRMAPACTAFYAAVTEGTLSNVTPDGPLRKALSRHLSNATVKDTPSGTVITKPKEKSPRKIDLAIAACVAFSEAVRAPVAAKAFVL